MNFNPNRSTLAMLSSWLLSLVRQTFNPAARYILLTVPQAAVQRLFDKTTRNIISLQTRPGWDHAILDQIFLGEEYNLRKLGRWADLKSTYDGILASGQRPLIVDCGANIGLTSLYLRAFFAEAAIIAIEPAQDNFVLATANLAGADVQLLQAGVAAHSGSGKVIDPGMGEAGYRVDYSADGGLKLISLNDILEHHAPANTVPFFCKIDIEGFEKDLFEANTEWVEAFPVVAIEFHDRLFPRQGSSRPALKCLAALDRDFEHHGESVFSISNKTAA